MEEEKLYSYVYANSWVEEEEKVFCISCQMEEEEMYPYFNTYCRLEEEENVFVYYISCQMEEEKMYSYVYANSWEEEEEKVFCISCQMEEEEMYSYLIPIVGLRKKRCIRSFPKGFCCFFGFGLSLNSWKSQKTFSKRNIY